MDINNEAIDSEGTTPEQARELLANLSKNGFSGNVADLAIALGRETELIEDILDGDEEVDEDLLMKIRRLAAERDLEIE